MENPSEQLRSMRNDLSPYLFHYTNYESPFLDWISILSEQKIKSTNNYICFTEAPVTCMSKILDYFEKKHGRFSKYCIGFDRNALIKEKGARPVIYGDKEEYRVLKDTKLNWRFEEFDLNNKDNDKGLPIDFTWQREWRINGNEFDFSDIKDNSIIVIGPDFETIRKDATNNKNLFHNPQRKYNVFQFEHIESIKDDFILELENLTNIDLSHLAINR